MATQRTIWTAECGCSIEYEWDDSVPVDQRIHTLTQLLHKGAEHAAILDASIFATLTEETERKGKTLGYLELQGYQITDTGDEVITPKQIVTSWTLGRTLEITFTRGRPGTAVRRNLETAIAELVGIGKVVIL